MVGMLLIFLLSVLCILWIKYSKNNYNLPPGRQRVGMPCGTNNCCGDLWLTDLPLADRTMVEASTSRSHALSRFKPPSVFDAMEFHLRPGHLHSTWKVSVSLGICKHSRKGALTWICWIIAFRTVVINDARILKQAFSSTALAGRPRMKPLDDMSHRRGICSRTRHFIQLKLIEAKLIRTSFIQHHNCTCQSHPRPSHHRWTVRMKLGRRDSQPGEMSGLQLILSNWEI